MEQASQLSNLPAEVITKIFTSCAPESQALLGTCSKSMYDIYSDERNNFLGWSIRCTYISCGSFEERSDWLKSAGNIAYHPGLEIALEVIYDCSNSLEPSKKKTNIEVFKWAITKDYQTIGECFEWTYEWETPFPEHELFETHQTEMLQFYYKMFGTDSIVDSMTYTAFESKYADNEYLDCWEIAIEFLKKSKNNFDFVVRMSKGMGNVRLSNLLALAATSFPNDYMIGFSQCRDADSGSLAHCTRITPPNP